MLGTLISWLEVAHAHKLIVLTMMSFSVSKPYIRPESLLMIDPNQYDLLYLSSDRNPLLQILLIHLFYTEFKKSYLTHIELCCKKLFIIFGFLGFRIFFLGYIQ